MTLQIKDKPKVVSIFSGCGGLDYGFHMEGYETVWANDFAEWACKSFAANFGNVIQYKDITKIDPYTDTTIQECDIVLGGFPCQDFSIIWKQPGLNGTRGGLFRHFAEFVDAKKPKAFVAENEGLKILDTEYAVEDYAIAVKKGNQELLDNINAALEKLTADGTIDEIIAKYIKAE